MTDTNIIKGFDNHRFLSNFQYVDVILDGVIYPSVEHAYQSAKSDNLEWKQICSDKNNTSGKIKKLSRSVILKKDWNNVKLKIMFGLLKQKFKQEPFRTLLLETDNAYIREDNWWRDDYWGYCLHTKQGRNYLGKMLMIIRKQLKNE